MKLTSQKIKHTDVRIKDFIISEIVSKCLEYQYELGPRVVGSTPGGGEGGG